MSTNKGAIRIVCAKCGKAVEVCCFCEDAECKHVMCRECLSVALRESRPSTYTTADQ